MSKRSSKIPASRFGWKRKTKSEERIIDVEGEKFVLIEPKSRPSINERNIDILKKAKELAGKEDVERSSFEDPQEAIKWINLVFQTEKNWLKSKYPKKSYWSAPVYFFNKHSQRNKLMPQYLGVRRLTKKERSNLEESSEQGASKEQEQGASKEQEQGASKEQEQGASKEEDVNELSSLMGNLSVEKEQGASKEEEADYDELSSLEDSDDDDELSSLEDSDDDVELTVVKGDEAIHQKAYSDDDAASHISLNFSDVELDSDEDEPLGEITVQWPTDPITREATDPTMLQIRYVLTDDELEEWIRGETEVNGRGKPYWSVPEVVIIKKKNEINKKKQNRLEQYLRDRWMNEGKGVIMVKGTPIDDIIEKKMKELFENSGKKGGRRRRKQRKTKRIGKKSKRHRKMGKRKTKKRKSMKKRTKKRR